MKLDDIKKLKQKKYRDIFCRFLVEGEHLVLELEKASKIFPELNHSELFVTDKYSGWSSQFNINVISEQQMNKISDTKTPQGIIAVAPVLSSVFNSSADISDGDVGNRLDAKRIRGSDKNKKKIRSIYLHEIQDPGNLGTILRSLAWFGSFRLLLGKNSVDPYNPKVVRSSMGAIFHLPIEVDVSLDALKQRYDNIACLDMQGKSISEEAFKEFDCYIFGNEARGIPSEELIALNTTAFTIEKGADAIDSLNLASAVNVSVYEISR